jgi:nitrite reductase/ring-hydroxylating ferredoxin subunit
MVLVKACDIAAFPPSGRFALSARARDIVIFKVGDAFFALERYCPHSRGDLFEGRIEGNHVECPVHGAAFALQSGKFLQTEYVSPHLARAMHDTKAFPVAVKDGAVYVDIP